MVKRAGGSLLLTVAIDPRSERPVSTQLYVKLREMILAATFSAGERLPASRTLARDLGLSRTTVIEAFDRLIAEGLVESRTGSGTYVSVALSAQRPRPVAANEGIASASAPQLSRLMGEAVSRFSERQRLPHMPRAFTTALPAFDAFPMAQWARLSAKYWRGNRDDLMGYGDPCGDARLREGIASHLRANRGIVCDTEQIFIVGGAQQAFHLIGTTLVNPRDKVWFENPGAIGARNSLIAAGADLVPVPVDADGLRVDEGLRIAPRFRLAFVTPSHQQPLGSVMSLERRFALLHAAQKAGAWIIEDDYDGEFFFGGRPPPTLKSVDTTGLVFYVGTFSKSLFPSLRLGYLVVPPPLVDTLRAIMTKFLQGVPSSTQAIVARFIDEGHFASHIRRMRRLYAERHEALIAAGRKYLRGRLDLEPTESGLHTVGYLDPAATELDVVRAADARGVTVSPIGRFAIVPVPVRGLVLGFAGVRPEQIASGVTTLAQVLDGYGRKPTSATRARRPVRPLAHAERLSAAEGA